MQQTHRPGLTERMRERAAENAAQRAAMTPADHAAERREGELCMARIRTEWKRAGVVAAPEIRRPPARPRGAGRPGGKRTAASSSTSSSDPGDPEPAALAVTIAGGDGSTGDGAVARMFERILVAQRPGTTWSATR